MFYLNLHSFYFSHKTHNQFKYGFLFYANSLCIPTPAMHSHSLPCFYKAGTGLVCLRPLPCPVTGILFSSMFNNRDFAIPTVSLRDDCYPRCSLSHMLAIRDVSYPRCSLSNVFLCVCLTKAPLFQYFSQHNEKKNRNRVVF